MKKGAGSKYLWTGFLFQLKAVKCHGLALLSMGDFINCFTGD